MISTLDLNWLAGLMEGEGSFHRRTMRNGSKQIVVSLNMTDEDVVRRAQAVVGAGKVYGPYNKVPGHKPVWMWQVLAQADAAGLMMTLYPLMGQRRQDQISAMLTIWKEKI